MKVSQVMTTQVETCSQHDFLSKAARVMWDNDCGCVPVTDADAKIVGIITDRDIAMAAYMQGLPLHSIRVESAMARTVVTCSPEDDLQTAEELMRQNQIRRIPVLDRNAKLVGIVSLNDLTLAAQRQREQETAEVTGVEIGNAESDLPATRTAVPAGHFRA